MAQPRSILAKGRESADSFNRDRRFISSESKMKKQIRSIRSNLLPNYTPRKSCALPSSCKLGRFVINFDKNILKNGPIPASFCLFSSFQNFIILNNIDISIDGVLGIRTQGGRMVCADESTELQRHPPKGTILANKLYYNVPVL